MKKITALLLSLAMIASLSACDSDENRSSQNTIKTETIVVTTIETTEKHFDTESFKKRIADFNDTVYAAGVLLSNAGNYESNYIDARYSFSGRVNDEPEEIYRKAIIFLMEEATPDMNMSETKLEDDYNAICKEYADIKATDSNIQELSAIRDEYEALFDGYTALYEVVSNPPISSFNSRFNEQVRAVEDANSKLKAFLN